jgi:2-polyprenyl-6-methoxyphenol hydroxylase-like FAD-dependent oxidoreductase
VTDRPNVTICGCGSGGMAMAADLAMLGCRVNLYETPAFAANLEPIRERRGYRVERPALFRQDRTGTDEQDHVGRGRSPRGQ